MAFYIIIQKIMNLNKNLENAFHLINQVRQNPIQFIEKYKESIPKYEGKIFKKKIKTRQGISAVNDLINDLRNRKNNPNKLKWCFGLHMIADQQARKLGESGLITTEGTSNHKTLLERSQQFVIAKGKISQVLQFGGENGDQIIDWLLVDDGLATRKRRNTLLDPTFQYIGIGTSLHSTYGIVTVIVLAQNVVSLVAPGRNGHYIKRQPIHQGQVKTLKIQQVKINQRNTIANSRSYNANSRIIPAQESRFTASGRQ